MAKNIVFEFSAKAKNTKALKTIERAFKKSGAEVVTTTIESKTRRSAGISYKKIFVTFADSQTVELWVKSTGDIFKVKLGGAGNARELPIKSQDDHNKAINEIVVAMTKGRKSFQKKLAKKKVPLPKGMKKTRVNILDALKTRLAELNEAIATAKTNTTALRSEVTELETSLKTA